MVAARRRRGDERGRRLPRDPAERRARGRLPLRAPHRASVSVDGGDELRAAIDDRRSREEERVAGSASSRSRRRTSIPRAACGRPGTTAASARAARRTASSPRPRRTGARGPSPRRSRRAATRCFPRSGSIRERTGRVRCTTSCGRASCVDVELVEVGAEPQTRRPRRGGYRHRPCGRRGCPTRCPAGCSPTTSRCTTRAGDRSPSGCSRRSRRREPAAGGLRDARLTERAPGSSGAAQRPIGCQTVFSSRKASISHGLCTSGDERTTRLTFSAASRSSSATVAVGAGEVDRVHVHVTGEPGRELVAEAGEDVDRAGGNVRRGERLGELDRGERVGLGRDRDDRVAADERRERCGRRGRRARAPPARGSRRRRSAPGR